MSTKAARFNRWPALALMSWVWVWPVSAWGSPDDATAKHPAVSPPRHADPSIRRALSLLSNPVATPVEVVEVHRLPQALRQAVGRAWTFVRVGVSRIYVSSMCPAYVGAMASRLEAIKLAALLRHELAHLEGADEPAARLIELRTFRDLVRRAPAECQTPGVIYANTLERLAAALAVNRERQVRAMADARTFD